MKKSSILIVLLICVISFSIHAADTVLATVDGHEFTEKEVIMMAAEDIFTKMKQDKAYNIKKITVNQMIDDWLLEKAAKKKGITVAKLKQQVLDKSGQATDAEAQTLFKAQQKRFQGKTFDDVKKQLMARLSFTKKQQALDNYIDELRKTAKIDFKLKRPRFTVSVDDDPSKGKKGAPITLIEFSEFQCPFCKKARPTITKILETYKDKVHYVFRDFPLSFHLAAKPAANAANCAYEQGKYWEYNTKMWDAVGVLSKGSRLLRDKKVEEGNEMLNKEFYSMAEGLKLDMGKFKKCVESKKYYSEIDKDMQEGSKSGVSGTPAYFVNGIFISGARGFGTFKEIIDEELKIKK